MHGNSGSRLSLRASRIHGDPARTRPQQTRRPSLPTQADDERSGHGLVCRHEVFAGRLGPRLPMIVWQMLRRSLALLLRPRVFGRKYQIAVDPNPSPGVNVVGYLRAELGIAEIARQIVRSVQRAGIPCSTLTYHRTLSRQEHPFSSPDCMTAPFDTNIICVNADQLPFFRSDVGSAFFQGRYSIGVWFWEVVHFPARFQSALDCVDEVWVASDFVLRAISAETSKPVRVVPLPIGEPSAVR